MRPHDLAEADGAAWAAAVLLHPHPDMGGDRTNAVVSALFDALPAIGVRTVRFDFSSSDLATAIRETEEALDLVGDAFLLGYSFGGMVAARVTDPRVRGWFLVAPPWASIDDPRPKAVVWAQHDQFAQAHAVEGAELTVVDGADHFFAGRTDAVVAAAVDWLRRTANR